MPEDNMEMEVELIAPIAIEDETRFTSVKVDIPLVLVLLL
jgi:translation elongation factor EF-Tu-like GTPase